MGEHLTRTLTDQLGVQCTLCMRIIWSKNIRQGQTNKQGDSRSRGGPTVGAEKCTLRNIEIQYYAVWENVLSTAMKLIIIQCNAAEGE